MTGFRNKKRANPFVQIDKRILSDSTISWKAKGILSYLLSKPNDWVTYVKDLEKRSTDGRDSVSSGIKELEEAGYIKRTRIRNKGRFKGWEYEVFEQSKQHSTENGKPEIGKTENGKPATSNNNLSNNDLSNKETLSELGNTDSALDTKKQKSAVQEIMFEEWWNLYANKKGRKKSNAKYKLLLKEYPHELIMAGTESYIQHMIDLARRGEFVPQQKHPLTFLNGENFNDEYETQNALIPGTLPVEEFLLDFSKGES